MGKNVINWEQIADILLEEFSKKDYKKDEKLPSENNLSIRFHVPRTEIRRALDRLKELGYIYSIQGCGSFFTGKKEKIRLYMTDSKSFSEKMKKLGVDYLSVNLGIEKAEADSFAYDMLHVPCDEPVYKITRLRLIDGSPAALHTSYVSEKNFPNIRKDGSAITSFFAYIKECGYTDFSNQNSEIIVSALTAKERELLHVAGYAPCLTLTTKCMNHKNGQILEAAKTIYRSDKFIFMV